MLQKTPIGETRDVESEERELRSTDDRVRGAWHAWLTALATDPEAAVAAALAYEALDTAGRVLWLDALEQDAPELQVPRVAIYAPLLSVEADPTLRCRIEAAVGTQEASGPRPTGRALRGVASNGDHVVAVVLPLYLSFVHVVACRIKPNDGFVWVRRDPILHDRDAPDLRSEIESVLLERTPLKPVVEELAHAILAHRRSGRELPPALNAFVDLFQPSLDDES